jgi:hypothetical protein
LESFQAQGWKIVESTAVTDATKKPLEAAKEEADGEPLAQTPHLLPAHHEQYAIKLQVVQTNFYLIAI